MARLHLLELEDQAWLPAVVRDAGTGYLRLAATLSGQARRLAPKLGEALARSGRRRIVDLCSGAAGPLPAIVEALVAEGRDVSAVLTDLHPARDAFAHVRAASQGRIDFVGEPVDALRVPPGLDGLRTLFNGFHHFRPAQARAILQSAVDAGEPIAVFELVRRSAPALAGIVFAPLAVLLLVPFLRPFRWAWLPLTWLVPVIPLFVLWDGVVSCLRVHEPEQLRALLAGVERDEDWTWEIGEVSMSPAPIPALYLLGLPPAAGRGETRARTG